MTIKDVSKKAFDEVLWLMPKSITHKYFYKKLEHKPLNLRNPVNFNEKIHYLIVYKYGKKEADLTDKIKVKDYINSLNIKDLYVPKILKVYKNVEDIDINELPDKFVLKCNHGSGWNLIVQDKFQIDLSDAKSKFDKVKYVCDGIGRLKYSSTTKKSPNFSLYSTYLLELLLSTPLMV